jgi:hypothetical protein
MPRRPARFTQADIARALRAAKQVGVHVAVEIALDGTIRLVPTEIEHAAELKEPKGWKRYGEREAVL